MMNVETAYANNMVLAEDDDFYIVSIENADKTVVENEQLVDINGSITLNENQVAPVKVNLYKNGSFYATKVVTKEDEWKFDFRNLPVFDENGEQIRYTVENEDASENIYYTFNVINEEALKYAGSKN